MILIAKIDLSFFANIIVNAAIYDSSVTKGSILLNGDASDRKEPSHRCLDNTLPSPAPAL